MRIIMLGMYALVTVLSLQGCAGTAPLQQPSVPEPNVTGQNMDFMYRSPSYQIGHMGR